MFLYFIVQLSKTSVIFPFYKSEDYNEIITEVSGILAIHYIIMYNGVD